jgi:hypothetical protein
VKGFHTESVGERWTAAGVFTRSMRDGGGFA